MKKWWWGVKIYGNLIAVYPTKRDAIEHHGLDGIELVRVIIKESK